MTTSSTTSNTANNLFPHIPLQQLIAVYSAGPARLRRCLVCLTDEHLLARPIPGKWSIKEIAIHLADAELMGAVRFRQALTGSDRTFSFYHQEIWCRDFDYQNADQTFLDQAVELFSSIRHTTTRLLENSPADRWTRTGYHPERGNMSVRQLLESYAEHAENHISQICERRRLLGKPIELEPLVPLRKT